MVDIDFVCRPTAVFIAQGQVSPAIMQLNRRRGTDECKLQTVTMSENQPHVDVGRVGGGSSSWLMSSAVKLPGVNQHRSGRPDRPRLSVLRKIGSIRHLRVTKQNCPPSTNNVRTNTGLSPCCHSRPNLFRDRRTTFNYDRVGFDHVLQRSPFDQ